MPFSHTDGQCPIAAAGGIRWRSLELSDVQIEIVDHTVEGEREERCLKL